MAAKLKALSEGAAKEEKSLAQAALERIRADKADELAKKRELKARLYAGNISNSQFGDLMGLTNDPLDEHDLL